MSKKKSPKLPLIKNFPYFLNVGVDYPLRTDYFTIHDIDKKLEWYFVGKKERTPKEIIMLKKQQKYIVKTKVQIKVSRIKELQSKGIIDKNIRINIPIEKNKLSTMEHQYDWQDALRKNKYVNNLEYNFNKVFLELVNRSDLADKSKNQLRNIFYFGAQTVSDRLLSILERNSFQQEVKFPLPNNWSKGQKLLSEWLIQDVAEFKNIKKQKGRNKSLPNQLIDHYGPDKIKKEMNRFSAFAEEIYSKKIFKKKDGAYYSLSTIRKSLYNTLPLK